MKKNICVFCSSSEDLDDKYYNIAKEMGKQLGTNNYDLIHGAGSIGLMGVMMKNAVKAGCKVIGVVPERLNKANIVSDKYQELIITPDMKERKEYMRTNAEAFIALPGGFGTLEELLETITLKQLKYHSKPIVIINAYNFYEPLLQQFNVFYNENFTNESYKKLYHICETPKDALEYINNYKPENIYDKYLKG